MFDGGMGRKIAKTIFARKGSIIFLRINIFSKYFVSIFWISSFVVNVQIQKRTIIFCYLFNHPETHFKKHILACEYLLRKRRSGPGGGAVQAGRQPVSACLPREMR